MADVEKKALIFGVNGFVGPYLSQEFASHGYEVFGSDRSVGCDIDCVSSFMQADLLDADEVAKAVAAYSPSVIVNLAAISSVGQSWTAPQATMQVNVVGALSILEAACSQRIPPKVMLIGSSEEYAPSLDPLSETSALSASNPYGISKMAQERFAEIYSNRYGMSIYYVRAFNHTGIGQNSNFVLPSFCKQAAAIDVGGQPGAISVGNLEVVRDFSDVRDIVRAYRMILEEGSPSEVYNVGSGIGHSLADLLCCITNLSEQDIDVVVDPGKLRPSDNPVIVCNASKIEDSIGWKTEHLIEDTLAEMFEAYRAQYLLGPDEND